MAEPVQEENRTEQPTPFKLREARERGAVAKSAELAGVLVLLAFAAFVLAAGRVTWERLLRQGAALLSQAHQPGFSQSSAESAISSLVGGLLSLLMPVFLVVIAAAALGVLLQTGPAFSLEPL